MKERENNITLQRKIKETERQNKMILEDLELLGKRQKDSALNKSQAE